MAKAMNVKAGLDLIAAEFVYPLPYREGLPITRSVFDSPRLRMPCQNLSKYHNEQ